MFSIIVIFLISEGVKKLWFETSSDRTKEYIYKLHMIFFVFTLLAVVGYFQIFTDPISDPETEFVVRPKDVQQRIDMMRNLRHLIFNNITLTLVLVLPLSSYHSFLLYKSREESCLHSYQFTGTYLTKLFMYAPIGFAVIVLGALFLELSSGSSYDDPTAGVLLKIILFAAVFYSGILVSINRLVRVGIYKVNWIKVMLRFVLFNLLAVALLCLFFIVSIANTDFSH